MSIVERVRVFYATDREPLRRNLYTALTLAIATAVALGALTGTLAATLTGVLPVLLMIPAAEVARQKVTPVADPVLTEVPDVPPGCGHPLP